MTMKTNDLEVFNIPTKQIQNNLPEREKDTGLDLAMKVCINQNGLLQPLVCRRIGKQFDLIDGRRRLAQTISLGLKNVPIIIIKASSIQAEILTLKANINTKELSGYEKDLATKKLHILEKSTKPTKDPAKPPVNETIWNSARSEEQSRARLKNASPVVLKEYKARKINQDKVNELIKLSPDVQPEAMEFSKNITAKKFKSFVSDVRSQGFALTLKNYKTTASFDAISTLETLVKRVKKELWRLNQSKINLSKLAPELNFELAGLIEEIETTFRSQELITRKRIKRKRSGETIDISPVYV